MLNEKIVVVTHGRWHSLDLAEQIHAAGRLAAVFTGYPRFKLNNVAIDRELIHSFPWFVTPYLALARFRFIPERALTEWAWHGGEALNRHAARNLPDCGLVTALSGSGRESGLEIHRRGGIYVCDRGSTHIVWQNRILTEEYGRLGLPWSGIDPRPIENEPVEYALADAITLPSQFTKRSFLEMGIPERKLRVVPYGVNLSAFNRLAERAGNFRVLFVGQLSVRKGLHYLLDAFNRARIPGSELVLVGGRSADTDALLKRYPVTNLSLLGHIPRADVAREMSRASVMVLPSIEEGLALVQAQALACGCPVIGTVNTGAEDLFTDGREGFIVPPRDVAAIVERLTQLYRNPSLIDEMGRAGLARVKTMGGWEAYGRASLAVFDELMARKSDASRVAELSS
jgi:glycosyltransferase involved in cell wall biosynthesis